MSDNDCGRDGVLRWARESLTPLRTHAALFRDDALETLGEMIGDARIVALSEAVHGSAEPLEFRNRLLQYLVQKKGFTVIAIESGLVEGRAVHDYVLGAAGDLPDVVAQGTGWNFDRLPQNHRLVEWLRDYNADAQHEHKVNFYGFDVPGSPGNPKANRGPQTALDTVLTYLDRIDHKAGAAFRSRLSPILPHLRFDFHRPADALGYDQLTALERDACTAAIADIVALLERREAAYIAAGTAADYEWTLRAGVGARQADAWLREVPIGWKPVANPIAYPSEETRFFSSASEVRDRAQVDNLEWIVRREGPAAKILIYASRFHLSAAPLHTNWGASDLQQVAGTYLRRCWGDDLIIIGNLVGKGEYSSFGVTQQLEQAGPESIDGLVAEAAEALFLLDLRRSPASVKGWLDQVHPIGRGWYDLSVGKAFDVLFCVDTITPA
jgi:erythromycin esterase